VRKLFRLRKRNEQTKSASPQPPQTTDVVTTSDWFSPNWLQGDVAEFDRYVPELGNDLLKGGKVLVFGKGGFEMRGATALPTYFDANFIGVKAEAENLKFVLEGGPAISNSLKFKYILIPAGKLAPGNSLDYYDYHAVCTWYKISE
jgi:hypothetical protein